MKRYGNGRVKSLIKIILKNREKLKMNKIKISFEELKVLSNLLPNMTVKEFLTLQSINK